MGNTSTGCVIEENTWTDEIMTQTFTQKKEKIKSFLMKKMTKNNKWLEKLEKNKLNLSEMCEILKFLASRETISLRFVILSLVKVWSNLPNFEMKDSTLQDIETWTPTGYPDWFETGLDNLKDLKDLKDPKVVDKIKEIFPVDKIAKANKLRFV